jgi:hypothetical protein
MRARAFQKVITGAPRGFIDPHGAFFPEGPIQGKGKEKKGKEKGRRQGS